MTMSTGYPFLSTKMESVHWHFECHTLERKLPSLNIPAVFELVAASPIPPRHGIASAALIPDARCQIIEDYGHFPWLEHPGSVRQALEATRR
jgi:pimeloyl-ACP methyl ester carboxylesterase